MATEYNAKLIADLYKADTVQKAVDISDEMTDIGDSIFPLQIYQIYKKFEGTTMRHYFISDLTQFKLPEADEILKKVALESQYESDINMLIDRMVEISFFPEELTNKVKNYLQIGIENGDIDSYDIEEYSEYLIKVGQINLFQDSFQAMFEDEEIGTKNKISLIKQLLKIDKKRYLNYYLENYEVIKGKNSEIIFVKEISTWKGGTIEKLYQKILTNGSPTAKQIIKDKKDSEIKANIEKEKIDQDLITKKFSNSEIVESLSKLRISINSLVNSNENFKHKFFEPTELLISQSSAAQSKNDIISAVIDLREIIRNFDQTIKNLHYELAEVQEVIPDVKEYTGTINKFHVYLKKKGLDVDQKIYGLRTLNIIVNKFAHPEQEGDLPRVLEQENLKKYFDTGDWSKLHNEILKLYECFLKKLLNVLKTTFE